MNAVIAAALISGGWTAAVAIVTTRINRKNTSQTIKAGAAAQAKNLAADRDARIWERQADAYQDALKTLLYREKKRHHDFRLHRTDGEKEKSLHEFFAAHTDPGWFETTARLLACAPQEVLDALDEAVIADDTARLRWDNWEALSQEHWAEVAAAQAAGEPLDPAFPPHVDAALQAMSSALGDADDKERTLRDLIRADLRRADHRRTRGQRRPRSMARRGLTKNTAPRGQGTYRISDTRCGRHLLANTARSTEAAMRALSLGL